MIKIQELRDRFTYNENTGSLVYRKTCGSLRVGTEAGHVYREKKTINGLYYVKVIVQGQSLLAHRICWAHYHGEWPDGQLDHINRDGTDNSINNLRLSTASQNQWNTSRSLANTSGFKGVTKSKTRGRWMARIRQYNKLIQIGTFASKQEAAHEYDVRAAELFGSFAGLNYKRPVL